MFKLSHKIKSLIKEGDRCLILSENRPYWLMSDIAVMNAGGISVPIFTTYSANDYKYILNDCKPSLIIVSNNDQFKKIKDYINPQEQKVISFEEVEIESLLIKNIYKFSNSFCVNTNITTSNARYTSYIYTATSWCFRNHHNSIINKFKKW